MGTSTYWDRKRVLVTGASGFIGRYLVGRLRELSAQVYGSRSPAGRPPTSEVNDLEPDVHRVRPSLVFDIRDAEAVQDAVNEARPDVVFHLAAVGATDPGVEATRALMVNAGGTVNLLQAVRKSDVDRVVLAGTSYEYGARGATGRLDPFNAYSASKVAAWAFGHMYWRAYGLPVVIVRPFQVYGPGQPDKALIPSAIRAALSGEDFPMTGGEQVRDFIFAEDIADGMIAAAEAAGIAGKSLDLGTGIGTSVRSVVDRIWTLADAEGSMRPGALPYRSNAAMDLVADADKTTQLTGWYATTALAEGLQVTMEELEFQMEQRR
jgi:dTDP-glucose 4,6-dehydratase